MTLLEEFYEAWKYFHQLILDNKGDKFHETLMKHASQKLIDIHHKIEAEHECH